MVESSTILFPFKMKALRKKKNHADIEIEPLERGFGTSLGVVLRRVLLGGHIRGARIVAIHSDDFLHGMSSIEGCANDVADICINLHKVRLKVPSNDPCFLEVVKSDAGKVYAKDIKTNSGIEILTPEIFLFETDGSRTVKFNIVVEANIGFQYLEDIKSYNKDLVGRVYVHSQFLFSPIENVAFEVQQYSLGRSRKLYDRLILSVTTDGSITPHDALSQAAARIMKSLEPITDKDAIIHEEEGALKEPAIDKKYFQKIDRFDFSTRIRGALQNLNIEYLGDLASLNPERLTSINNFGTKSLQEVKDLFNEQQLEWGIKNWPASRSERARLHEKYYKEDI